MEQYPPFPFRAKNLPPHLKVQCLTGHGSQQIVEAEGMQVELLNLGTVYEVKIKGDGKIIFETEEGGPFVYATYYADLDNNRLKDFIMFSSYLGCGLAGYNDRVDILLQTERYIFSHIHYDTMSASLKDIVDINHDGIYEVIFTGFYSGRRHNYFVYSIYEIKNAELHNANKKYSQFFPKFIRFTHKPNDQQSTKITIEEKKEFLKRLPGVIKKPAGDAKQ